MFAEANWTLDLVGSLSAGRWLRFSGRRRLCPASEARPGTGGSRVPADDVGLRVAPAADRNVGILA